MKKTLIGKAASYGSTATTKDGARRYLIKHIKTLREKARPLEKRGQIITIYRDTHWPDRSTTRQQWASQRAAANVARLDAPRLQRAAEFEAWKAAIEAPLSHDLTENWPLARSQSSWAGDSDRWTLDALQTPGYLLEAIGTEYETEARHLAEQMSVFASLPDDGAEIMMEEMEASLAAFRERAGRLPERSARRTVHLSPEAQTIIGQGQHMSLSGRINSIIHQYGAICTDACPALTQGEWCAICDVLNGTWLQAETSHVTPGRWIGHELAEAVEDGTGEKWGIDLRDLARRVNAMDLPAKIALTEVVVKFWAGCDRAAPLAEQLIWAGANIKADGEKS